MTATGSLVAAIAVGAIVLLALALGRSRREESRLRVRLEAASSELERLQRTFARFAPGEVVERVIAGGASTSGERKEVTALYADLVGFTALCEAIEPAVLVRILNGYFGRLSNAITSHGGHVSTFIGDGVLALFGAFEPNPWQSNDAAHAALAMREGLADYNHELEAEGLPRLALGVGLHRGTGVAGLVGSRELLQYAFVGRTVNVAARVQDLTREHRIDILLTEDVREKLDPRFLLRPLGAVGIRGVPTPISIHALEGFSAQDRRKDSDRDGRSACG